jgi:hypothetical protein
VDFYTFFIRAPRLFSESILRNAYHALVHKRVTLEAIVDLLYLAGIGIFFALMIGLAIGCNKLGGAK